MPENPPLQNKEQEIIENSSLVKSEVIGENDKNLNQITMSSPDEKLIQQQPISNTIDEYVNDFEYCSAEFKTDLIVILKIFKIILKKIKLH